MPVPAKHSQQGQVARPLKVLVPLIQAELHQGNTAGRDHYRRAGQMLLEAQAQVARGGWGQWLTKHFDLSSRTAALYMQWARAYAADGAGGSATTQFTSLNDLRGETERERARRNAERPFRQVLRDVAREDFAQERQVRRDEIDLHRELALELIDIGYKALATRLHPDRGGSKDAMVRLNRVRDELKGVAETRRFV